jgi:thioredoxin 1
MAENIIVVGDANFQHDVLEASKPVVVDFWASWCRPCLMMAPIFEEFSNQYHDKMVFAKLNTDENQELATRLGIQGIPTLIFFHNGHEVDRVVGLEQREALRRHIDAAITAAV